MHSAGRRSTHRQFAFARTVESAQARLATAQAQARQLHAQSLLRGASAHPGTDDAVNALDAKVVAIAAIVDVPNPGNAGTLPPKSTHTFAFLSQALGKVSNAVDGADAAPSPDTHHAYEVLVPIVDDTLTRWQAISQLISQR